MKTFQICFFCGKKNEEVAQACPCCGATGKEVRWDGQRPYAVRPTYIGGGKGEWRKL